MMNKNFVELFSIDLNNIFEVFIQLYINEHASKNSSNFLFHEIYSLIYHVRKISIKIAKNFEIKLYMVDILLPHTHGKKYIKVE